MNFRLTAILFAVVLVLVAGLLVAVLVDDAPPGDAPLLDLARAKPEDVDSVELVRTEPTEQKLSFVRVDKDKWELREPAGPQVEGFQVSNLVRELVALKPTPFADTPSSLTDAGLKPPSLKVTLRKGGGKEATLLVGDTTPGKDKAVTFVATGDRPNTPVAVKRSDLDALFKSGGGSGKAWQLAKWLPDYRQKRLLGADLRDAVADLKTVKITRGKQELALARSEAGDWTFTAPANYGLADTAGDPAAKPDAFTGVRPLLTYLTGLFAGGPDDFIETPGAAEQYGLKADDPNLVRVELVPKTGPAEVLLIGKKVDEKATPTKWFVKLPGDPAVVKLQADRIDALAKTLADPTELRDRTLVPEGKKEQIDAVEVAVGGQTTKLRKVTVNGLREWVLYGGPTDPQLAKAARELIDAVTKPRGAKEVLTTPADAAFAPPEVRAVVKLWTDGTEPPAKDAKPGPDGLPAEPKMKPGDPAVTLTFGKKEGDLALVRRKTAAGQTDLKVPESVFALAGRGRVAYLDPKLKGFSPATATKLTFNRGPEVYELTKDEKAGTWTFAKPEKLKGRAADSAKVSNDVLNLLATQPAGPAAAEQPTPEQAKGYGLDPAAPVTKVTVGLNTPDDKERVYLFGNDTADKQSVYATQPGRPVVFTVPKFVAEKFAAADLRDLTLYTLDAAKVKSITLNGYKAAGPVQRLQFKREGAGWAVAAGPPGFTADAAKLDALVAAFAAPKPLSSTGGGQRPEHGFAADTGKNPWEVTLEVEGRPAISLNLGNETPDGFGYYTWCNTVPDGEVMVLPTAPFKPYKEKPDYLKR